MYCAGSYRLSGGTRDKDRAGEASGVGSDDAEDVLDLVCVDECNVPPECAEPAE